MINNVDGSGKLHFTNNKTMNDQGYDRNGHPISFTDDKGQLWVYIGKGLDGADHWMGMHKER